MCVGNMNLIIKLSTALKGTSIKLMGETKIVNKVSQRSLRTNERSIRYREDLYVSDVTAIYLSL